MEAKVSGFELERLTLVIRRLYGWEQRADKTDKDHTDEAAAVEALNTFFAKGWNCGEFHGSYENLVNSEFS